MINFFILLFVFQSLYYIQRDYHKIDWAKLSYIEKCNKFGNLPFKSAWNTKYHWGTIIQVILIILINILNFFE